MCGLTNFIISQEVMLGP